MQRCSFLKQLSTMDIVVYTTLFLFSSWLMINTFSYDSAKQVMILAPIIQSDFAAHIPLIRSFSLGSNWPPEYPIFPGSPIQYHFLFYYLVAMLEKIGFRIDWALNSLSIAGFFAMTSMTYAIGNKLFNDKRIGLLSVLFFIFNGTLEFWYYFNTKAGFTWEAFKHIFTTDSYASFGPWDGPVLIFWNLNTFINQRHFAFALGVLLAFVYACMEVENRKKTSQIAWGILFGLIFATFPLLHKPVMLLAGIVMACYFVFFARMRLFLLFSGGISLLGMILLHLSSFKITTGENTIGWNLGFLVPDPHHLKSYFEFFFLQFGFHCFLAPIGLILAPRRVKIIMLPAIIAFIFSFIFKFSADISANHKLINFSIIMLQMLSAYLLFLIYNNIRAICWNPTKKINAAIKAFSATLLFFIFILLTFSGIMDIFVAINQPKGDRLDVNSSSTIEWIVNNTEKTDIILNASFIFDPASVAGRRIFLGYAYFVMSAGYDFGARAQIYREIYTSRDPYRIIKLLNENKIRYVEFNDELRNDGNLEVMQTHQKPNEDVFKKYFPTVYKDGKKGADGNVTIYKVPSTEEWLNSLSAEEKSHIEKLLQDAQGDYFFDTKVDAGITKLQGHAAINVDSQDNIIILEIEKAIIRIYSTGGVLLNSFGETGDKLGQMKDPNGLTTDADGNIYVADTWNHRIQKFKSDGSLITDWSSQTKLFAPQRIRIAPDNSIYVLDTGGQRVVHLSPDGRLIASIGKHGSDEGEFNEPTDIVIGDNQLFIADTGNLRVQIFDMHGKFIDAWPIPHWVARSWNKFRLAWNNKLQQIYITNFVSGEIYVHNKKGDFLGVLKPNSRDAVAGISDIFVSKHNDLFAFDISNSRLLKIHNLKPQKNN